MVKIFLVGCVVWLCGVLGCCGKFVGIVGVRVICVVGVFYVSGGVVWFWWFVVVCFIVCWVLVFVSGCVGFGCVWWFIWF